MKLRRVLVANRGEIAVRIIRAARKMGLETVLVASSADVDGVASRLADTTLEIGPAAARKSYLRADLLVHAAIHSGCDALHPGYGFLSENGDLARLCEQNNLVFVGPRSETIDALGDKLQARTIAAKARVPVVPGSPAVSDVNAAVQWARKIGYPVLIKAAAGGGGRGMFIARDEGDIRARFDQASAEAKEAFGDGCMYIERFVARARHVEVQVMGDGHGNVLHFGERDCSVQRRYQKLVEEAPCTALPDELRKSLHRSAVDLVASLKYRGAGTVEYLFDVEHQAFYFIEVNARIQVEHPVTEQVTGRDLVAMQFHVASDEALALSQDDITVTGHAIECRINAEDPVRGFLPSPGRITKMELPTAGSVRVDTHCEWGSVVPPYYDSMIGKLIVGGPDRQRAIESMRESLREFVVEGIATNLDLHRVICNHDDFVQNRLDTHWLERAVLPAFAAR